MNLFDNIYFCLNVIYDLIYNKNSLICYKMNYINKKKITIGDIKKPNNFDYSSIINKKFKYIDKYDSNNIKRNYKKWNFYSTNNDNFNFLLTIGKYNNKKNINVNDHRRLEIINMKSLYILSELVINNNIKHIIIPIMNFDVKYSNIKNNYIYEFVDKCHDNDILYFSICDYINNKDSLYKYILKNKHNITNEQWDVIIFQVLYTIFEINNIYLKFKHGKLDLYSIKICYNDKNNYKYKIYDDTYIIPNVNFYIAISNFEHCNIFDNNIIDDPFYDICYFFNSLYKLLIKINEKENKNYFDYIIKYIKNIIPKNLLYKNKNIISNEYYINKDITPIFILKKNIFLSKYINNKTMSDGNNNNIVNKYSKTASKKNNINNNNNESITENTNSMTDEESNNTNKRLLANIKNKNNLKKTKYDDDLKIKNELLKLKKKLKKAKNNDNHGDIDPVMTELNMNNNNYNQNTVDNGNSYSKLFNQISSYNNNNEKYYNNNNDNNQKNNPIQITHQIPDDLFNQNINGVSLADLHNANNNNNMIPQMPSNNIIPQMPSNNMIPQMPSNNMIPQMPSNNMIPQMPSNNMIPQMPSNNMIPQMPSNNMMPQMPNNNMIPQMPSNNMIPQMPSNNMIPQMPNNNMIPQMPSNNMIPQMPNNNMIPQIPNNNMIPQMPNNNIEQQFQNDLGKMQYIPYGGNDNIDNTNNELVGGEKTNNYKKYELKKINDNKLVGGEKTNNYKKYELKKINDNKLVGGEKTNNNKKYELKKVDNNDFFFF
jgi:hypothetical protein